MFIDQILHRGFQWKWMVIIPAVLAPFFSGISLLFSDPSYVSSCRLWVKERAESSQLLKIQRLGQQQNTYVEVQRDIFTSNPVLEDVAEGMGLTNPPPKQSIWANLTGMGKTGDSISMIHATDALRNRIWVDVINPEIIVVGCRMNTPELAQQTLTTLVEAYRRQYLSILNVEVTEYKRFLYDALLKMLAQVEVLEQDLKKFEAEHPITATMAPSPSTEGMLRGTPEIGLIRQINEVSPVPQMVQELARLEMEQRQAQIRYTPESERMRRLNEQIAENRMLLEQHVEELSKNAQLAVKHETIKWRLQEARRQYTFINTEYHQILVAEGTKLKQTSSVALLNRPTFESEQISPRKKATLMASGVLGVFFGVALFYLRFLLNTTYCMAEQVEQDLGVPVLASLPLVPAPRPGWFDRFLSWLAAPLRFIRRRRS